MNTNPNYWINTIGSRKQTSSTDDLNIYKRDSWYIKLAYAHEYKTLIISKAGSNKQIYSELMT